MFDKQQELSIVICIQVSCNNNNVFQHYYINIIATLVVKTGMKQFTI